MNHRFRTGMAALLLTLTLLAAPAHAQITLPGAPAGSGDIPPADAVFQLSADAPSRERIVLRWVIAEGYYLYRDRTSVEVLGSGFRARPLQREHGKKHHDEFFGEVEIWRYAAGATLPGTADAAAREVTLRVMYQGCADAGICYPPQTRTLTVVLPSAPIAVDPATPVVMPRTSASQPVKMPSATKSATAAEPPDPVQPTLPSATVVPAASDPVRAAAAPVTPAHNASSAPRPPIGMVLLGLGGLAALIAVWRRARRR